MKLIDVFLILSLTEAGREVLEFSEGMPETREAHMMYGVYDIIARIEADTMQNLIDVVTSKIKRLKRVRATMMMHVAEDAVQELK